MSDRISRGIHRLRGQADEALTPEQRAARESWQKRWNLPIILAAFLPLFITSTDSLAVSLVIGIGSWIVFVVDLYVQRRIVPGYLRTRRGQIDLAIVLITFPYYLIPGIAGESAILLLARLARVARVLLATSGLRRFAARLGKVATIAGIVVVVASLAAYQAEHPTNPGFATIGDAFWWGVVTLTTVGYGDIVPKTTAGRFAGVAIMFTGVAVLGVLAGSLAELFHISGPGEQHDAPPTEGEEARPAHEELTAIREQLRAVESRLGDLAERTQSAADLQ